MIGRYVLIAVLALVLVATCPVSPTLAEPYTERVQLTARISWYAWTGNRMASGLWPYEGAAACSFDLPLGTWVELDGRTLRCEDRGRLEPTHLDIFCETAECVRWAESLWPTATATIGGTE